METETTQKSTKSHWKAKTVSVLLLIIIGLGAYGYFWYQGVQKRDVEARTNIETVAKYVKLKESISVEYEKCQQLITKKQGDFGDFEYCKKFIDWSDGAEK